MDTYRKEQYNERREQERKREQQRREARSVKWEQVMVSQSSLQEAW